MKQRITQPDASATSLWLADRTLFAVVAVLLCLGLVMVTSASVGIAEQRHESPLYFAIRQLAFVALAVAAAHLVLRIPLSAWQRFSMPLWAAGIVCLVLVLMPGIGREVNGSVRWLPLGIINFQVSEAVKLLAVVFMAGYLAQRGEDIRGNFVEFAKPLGVLAVAAVLLLLEPDFGATVVMMSTAIVMLFLAGVKLRHFLALIAVAAGGFAALVISAPYRMQRLQSFLHACEEEYVFDQGYQLCQALIAFGRGEWLGVGLGSSVQKLFYLPEAHTDFLLAVLGEELGVVGTLVIIALFTLLVWRAFVIARRAEAGGHVFGAFVAYGIGTWLGLQAFVNIGVNMGVLPTKGLTLPLMSYGGSSLVVTCMAVAMLLRVAYESPAVGTSSVKEGLWLRAS